MDTIRDIWENSVGKYADLPAVRWLEKKDIKECSYGELNDEVIKIRRGLSAEGFKGAHIALIGFTSVSWVESYLAVTTGNNVAVPLDANLPEEELFELLNRSDSEALFLDEKLVGKFKEVRTECPELKQIWILKEGEEEGFDTLSDLKKTADMSDDVAGNPSDEIATIIYTSGTTGKSKGVMLTQQNLANNVAAVPYEDKVGTVMMSVLPIHHAYCLVMDWLKGFSLGAVVCINDSLMHMVRNMSIYKPRVILMVPLMIESIYKRLNSADPSVPKEVLAENVFGGNLHIIFTGGAHLDPFYIEKFAEYGIDILEGYGMSECSPVISSNMPDAHKTGSIGRPLSNVEIKFENGEILVRGSSVMKGYYKMPDETAETIGDGWLHTGDKGYLDEDGFLFINGRVKNLIILSNGENISPEEIESRLGTEELIAEIIVTGENNTLTARIYPDADYVALHGMDEAQVKEKLQEIIDNYNSSQPTYRHITAIIVRKNPFKRNATRKILRQFADED